MLCCFALLFFLTLLASFFLPSASLIKTCVQCVPRIKKRGGWGGGDLAGAQSVNLYLGEGPGASEYFILTFIVHTCTWCHWWFHYPGLLLHTEFMVSLFIRCTMRCEIWAQPAELPR